MCSMWLVSSLRKSQIRVAAGLLLGIAAAPATAQDFIANQAPVMAGIANTAAMNSVLRNAYGRPGTSRKSAPANARITTAGDVALDYRPSAALARQAVDGYLARASQTSPEGARVYREQFARHDYRSLYRGLIAGAGLRENDAGDALAAYTLLGWQIANRSTASISNEAVRAVRSQLVAAVGGSEPFAPGNRAALGEELKLLYVTLHSGWQAAQREGTTRAYSDGVAALFSRQAQTDLRTIRITDNGITPR